jgi:putative addiction module component (TIGR02574 family)
VDLPALLTEINALPVVDRIRLAQAIWDSIPEDEYPPDLTPEQQAELDRRLADLRADPSIVLTWDEIKEGIRRNKRPRV